jgi:hypothetical protein
MILLLLGYGLDFLAFQPNLSRYTENFCTLNSKCTRNGNTGLALALDNSQYVLYSKKQKHLMQKHTENAVTHFFNRHGKVLGTLVAGVAIGGVVVNQGYIGWHCGESANGCELVKKGPVPKSLILKGSWFFRTKTSGAPLKYDDKACTSVLGTAEISQAELSNELYIEGIRKSCVSNYGGANASGNTSQVPVNVGWTSKNAAVLPDSRRIMISLSTRDPSPRTGYIEGILPKGVEEKAPTKFEGNMDYLNAETGAYGAATIEFCKAETDCAKEIERQIPK